MNSVEHSKMNHTALLLSTILLWLAFFAGVWQRIFLFPKWFANPPASFELIRQQRKKANGLWIILSALILVSLVLALAFNWKHYDGRVHIIAGLICFILIHLSGGFYFVREIIAFTKIPPDAPPNPDLLRRVKKWLRWTIIREVLNLFAAIFVSIAYNHV